MYPKRALLFVVSAIALTLVAAPAGARQDDPTRQPSKPAAQPDRKPRASDEKPQARPDRKPRAGDEKPQARPDRKPRAGDEKSQAESDGRPDADRDDASEGGGRDVGRDGGGKGAAKSSGPAERKLLLEESKYRKRMAKIRRLRELATEQGNAQRLRALDDLERRLTSLHERKIERWQGRLDGDRRKKVDDRIKRGRGHAKGGKGDKGRPEGRGRDGGADRPDGAETTTDDTGRSGRARGGAGGKEADGPGKGKSKQKGASGRGSGKGKSNGRGGKP